MILWGMLNELGHGMISVVSVTKSAVKVSCYCYPRFSRTISRSKEKCSANQLCAPWQSLVLVIFLFSIWTEIY